MDMLDMEVRGIHCYKNHTFYYLEKGDHFSITDLDRVKNTLIARDLITLNDRANLSTGYRIITLAEARLENLKEEPIYLSKHIKSVIEAAAKAEANKLNLWD